MKVYILVYSNNFIEEWDVKGVYSDKEHAHREAEKLANKQGDRVDMYHVEAHNVQDPSN